MILMCGGSTARSANAPLAAHLSEHFTVFNYDRRGDRGEPYAVEREVEYIADVIPDVRTRILECQDHNVAADAFAIVLEEFFTS